MRRGRKQRQALTFGRQPTLFLGQHTLTLGQIQRGDFGRHENIVGLLLCPYIPEAYLLIIMAADNRRAKAVGCAQIVAAGAGELGLDAGDAA